MARHARAPFQAVAALRTRPGLLRLQVVQGLPVAGKWTETVAITVAAFRVGGPELVAVSLLVRKMPMAVLGPVLGAVVERRRPLTVLRLSTFLSALLATLSAAAVIEDRAVWVAIVAGALLGLCSVSRRVANGVMIPNLVRETRELTSVAVINRGFESLGLFVGPALAGALILVGGPAAAFLGVAALNLVALVLLADPGGADSPAPRRVRVRHHSRRQRWRREAAGMVRPFRHRELGPLMVLVLLMNAANGLLLVQLAPLAVDELDVGESAVGWLTAAIGAGGLLGSVVLFGLAGSRRMTQITDAGLLLACLALALVPTLASPASVAVAMFVFGLGTVVFEVALQTTIHRGADPSQRGQAFASAEASHAVGYGLGALAGALLSGLAPSTAIGLSGLVLAVMALALWPWMAAIDRRLVAPEAEIALLRRSEVFDVLPIPALEQMAMRLDRSEHADGEVIIRQGEAGSTYHLVEEGAVTVLVDDQTVNTLGPGDGFGEVALVTSSPRTATCVADGRTVTRSVDGDDFLAVLGGAVLLLDDMAASNLARAAPEAVRPPMAGGGA